ncbi:uncharacterized protein LOC110907044 isoform X2 [Helianthus annuus]|uniref:uncharacterized protein LOC110907044 isoform X2 n=1 Tax=Helianthus annuus TaxID=4232 RepID=UPI000B8FA396|nr:uncharacterized protein LOC110907044 isoform X2 [Helianthus annuus]
MIIFRSPESKRILFCKVGSLFKDSNFGEDESCRMLIGNKLSSMTSDAGNENCLGWAARDPSGFLSPYKFNRRDVGADDVSITITHYGVCYVDVCRGIMQEQDKGAVVEEWCMRLKMMVRVGGCRWCWDEEEVGGDLGGAHLSLNLSLNVLFIFF